MSDALQLADDVSVVVAYRDRNPAGSPVSQGPAVVAREVFAPMLEHLRDHGRDSLVGSSSALLEEVRNSPEFARVAEPHGSAWQVHEHVRFPDPAHSPPGGLALRRPGPSPGTDDIIEAPVALDDWVGLHHLFGALASADGLRLDAVPARFSGFVGALRDRGFAGAPAEPDGGHDDDAPITFVGHNTTVIRSPTTAVVTDPYLLAPVADVPGYRPLPRRLLGAIDAILLTHSHPDHFDPASLLRFDPSIPIVVPVVERETILAVDLVRRLAELGCTDVRPLAWWASTRIGDLTVTALPFYGEQPGDGAVLHPEIRNAGNTYLVDGPSDLDPTGYRVALLADSGADHRGDIRQVASSVGAERPVDLVFSGYRAWRAHPAELVTSSVAQYLYFVPPDRWPVRQRLMNGPVEAVEAAERFGARWLVPCADGGAPWHWQIGLGPVLDGTGEERSGFDPFPERVVEAGASSSVESLLLRPGDALAAGPTEAPEVRRRVGYAWPYA